MLCFRPDVRSSPLLPGLSNRLGRIVLETMNLAQNELDLDLHQFPKHLTDRLRRERVAEVSYLKGATIFREGEEGHEAFFVLSGTVEIVKKTEAGEPRVLDVLEVGALFGEMALIDQLHRSATARAGSDCHLFVIPKARFIDLIASVPQMGMWMLETFSRRLRHSDGHLVQMEKVQEVATRVIEAHQHERHQLAREILAGPAEELSDLVMKVELCERLAIADPRRLRQELTALKDALRHSLSRLTSLVKEVTPEAVEREGLESLLRTHIERVQTDTGLTISLACPPIPHGTLDFTIQNTVFCLVQAALTNIHDYGHAKRVELAVGLDQGRLSLLIADDGSGFEMAKVRAGFYREEMENYDAMRERVRLVGGQMRLKSQPGKGTLVDVSMPVKVAI
jgi:signal transduction histidine kinase